MFQFPLGGYSFSPIPPQNNIYIHCNVFNLQTWGHSMEDVSMNPYYKSKHSLSLIGVRYGPYFITSQSFQQHNTYFILIQIVNSLFLRDKYGPTTLGCLGWLLKSTNIKSSGSTRDTTQCCLFTKGTLNNKGRDALHCSRTLLSHTTHAQIPPIHKYHPNNTQILAKCNSNTQGFDT